MKTLPKVVVPDSFNYVGAFLTFRCSLGCGYCINTFGTLVNTEEMGAIGWTRGLNRLVLRDDLPVSFQGGEPTKHEEFYAIVKGVKQPKDLLTNGMFNVLEFMEKTKADTFRRDAKYAGVRFSFHEKTDEWRLLSTMSLLQREGYRVGVWMLDAPWMAERNKKFARLCAQFSIDCRTKEFLDETHGTYKYEGAVGAQTLKNVLCKPSELLIAPDGRIYRCHSDLYAGVGSVGHILDPGLTIKDEFERCERFGACNPCDVKVKNNRFQEWGHCSVEIKGMEEV